MSKVYIEGFKMPKSCGKCSLLYNFGSCYCSAKPSILLPEDLTKKSKDCPLREVKQ